MIRPIETFLLVCALATLSGCVSQPATERQPVTRVLVIPAGGSAAASAPAAAPASDVPPVLAPGPIRAYASLEAARDSIGAIVSRSFSHADTAIHVSREAATFEYIYAKTTAPGWAFHIVVTDTSSCPFMAVQKALNAAGWVEHYGYMADGADGSNVGFVCQNFFCLVEGQWDGGDVTDSTYVPVPGCQVVVTCVPRRADDIPPR